MWEFPSWSKHHGKEITAGLNLRDEAIRLLNVGNRGESNEIKFNKILYLVISHFKVYHRVIVVSSIDSE